MKNPKRLAFITWYYTKGLFWVRVNINFGASIKDIRRKPLLFGERNGATKIFRIGPYSIKIRKNKVT